MINLNIDGSKILESVKSQRILSNGSSGRLDIWKDSLKLFKKNYFGYGPQADRILLDQMHQI